MATLLFITGETSFWFCLMSRLFCFVKSVLTWLVLEFLNERYVLHYKRTPTTEKIVIWAIGLYQKKLSWTKEASDQSHPFSKIPKENVFKNEYFFRTNNRLTVQSSHFISPEQPFYTKMTPRRIFCKKSSEIFKNT